MQSEFRRSSQGPSNWAKEVCVQIPDSHLRESLFGSGIVNRMVPFEGKSNPTDLLLISIIDDFSRLYQKYARIGPFTWIFYSNARNGSAIQQSFNIDYAPIRFEFIGDLEGLVNRINLHGRQIQYNYRPIDEFTNIISFQAYKNVHPRVHEDLDINVRTRAKGNKQLWLIKQERKPEVINSGIFVYYITEFSKFDGGTVMLPSLPMEVLYVMVRDYESCLRKMNIKERPVDPFAIMATLYQTFNDNYLNKLDLKDDNVFSLVGFPEEIADKFRAKNINVVRRNAPNKYNHPYVYHVYFNDFDLEQDPFGIRFDRSASVNQEIKRVIQAAHAMRYIKNKMSSITYMAHLMLNVCPRSQKDHPLIKQLEKYLNLSFTHLDSVTDLSQYTNRAVVAIGEFTELEHKKIEKHPNVSCFNIKHNMSTLLLNQALTNYISLINELYTTHFAETSGRSTTTTYETQKVKGYPAGQQTFNSKFIYSQAYGGGDFEGAAKVTTGNQYDNITNITTTYREVEKKNPVILDWNSRETQKTGNAPSSSESQTLMKRALITSAQTSQKSAKTLALYDSVKQTIPERNENKYTSRGIPPLLQTVITDLGSGRKVTTKEDIINRKMEELKMKESNVGRFEPSEAALGPKMSSQTKFSLVVNTPDRGHLVRTYVSRNEVEHAGQAEAAKLRKSPVIVKNIVDMTDVGYEQASFSPQDVLKIRSSQKQIHEEPEQGGNLYVCVPYKTYHPDMLHIDSKDYVLLVYKNVSEALLFCTIPKDKSNIIVIGEPQKDLRREVNYKAIPNLTKEAVIHQIKKVIREFPVKQNKHATSQEKRQAQSMFRNALLLYEETDEKHLRMIKRVESVFGKDKVAIMPFKEILEDQNLVNGYEVYQLGKSVMPDGKKVKNMTDLFRIYMAPRHAEKVGMGKIKLFKTSKANGNPIIDRI